MIAGNLRAKRLSTNPAAKHMTPEDEARAEIDRKLAESGWVVQDRGAMNIAAGPGVAIREFPLPVGEADYLLYADMRAIGVVEAKPKGFALTGVEGQSKKYVEALPEDVPAHRLPLPFHYESTGSITQFTNLLEPDARSREVFAFHRPEELLRLAGLEEQFRGGLRRMPPLNVEKLWPVQARAVANLEKSLADNRPRSLVQMATGSGKTFTAVSLLYRLVKFAGAKRVLFLVDRKNLGRQTYDEFQKYVSPYNGYKFTDEFNVQHLRSNAIAPASRVCIATIQRVYSMLKGDEEFDEADEEVSSFELASDLIREQMPVAYNPKIPIETFDVIVADECHRSIYNLWRQVLDYFDASLVGLTATPTGQTIGFFRNNLVMEYGHNDAVADGVNVGYQVYRIRTQITEGGAILEQEPGCSSPGGIGGPGRCGTPPSTTTSRIRPANSTATWWPRTRSGSWSARSGIACSRKSSPAARWCPRRWFSRRTTPTPTTSRGSFGRSSARGTTSARRSPTRRPARSPTTSSQSFARCTTRGSPSRWT